MNEILLKRYNWSVHCRFYTDDSCYQDVWNVFDRCGTLELMSIRWKIGHVK